MNSLKQILLLVILALLTGCAPIIYEPAPQGYYYPSGGYYGSAQYGPGVYAYAPIEVTLYARSGAYLQTIVIHDHEYIDVPIRTREGRVRHVFAHYQGGDLHFDSNRHNNSRRGTVGFRYDKSWEKGRRYNRAINGDEYLGGFSVTVRHKNVNQSRPDLNRNPLIPARNVNQRDVQHNIDRGSHSSGMPNNSYDRTHKGRPHGPNVIAPDNKHGTTEVVNPPVDKKNKSPKKVYRRSESTKKGRSTTKSNKGHVVEKGKKDNQDSSATQQSNQEDNAGVQSKPTYVDQNAEVKQKEESATGDVRSNEVSQERSTHLQQLWEGGRKDGN